MRIMRRSATPCSTRPDGCSPRYTCAFSSIGTFPTRRSSDLDVDRTVVGALTACECSARGGESRHHGDSEVLTAHRTGRTTRSEEHTSALQSHSDLVYRLLLEKKNGDQPGVPQNDDQIQRMHR